MKRCYWVTVVEIWCHGCFWVSHQKEIYFCNALTCDEVPDLCVSGLRDLSKAVGLMRRSGSPPCSGCSEAGISSFSNTDENSSLRTCRTNKNTVADEKSIKHVGWPADFIKSLFHTFWASSLTLVQSGLSATHIKNSWKASSFRSAFLNAVALK